MKNLIVRLSNSKNHTQIYDLHFDLIQSSFLDKWIERYLHAQQRQDNISEPWAFYNINDKWNKNNIRDKLNYHIDKCNEISPGMFDRHITDLKNQDDTNYLHWVFEVNHGQLDEWKEREIFNHECGIELREHLSQINQTIHRCESFNGNPRIRVVYFDLPKDNTFAEEDYKLFVNNCEFGGVYTLYADVGKNLESLAKDNDDYVEDFVPNLHYSVDFQILFHDDDRTDRLKLYQEYLNVNKEYFINKGYTLDDPRLTTGSIKLAQLKYNDKQEILNNLKNYDNVQSVFVF